ncbi:hypothetical protein OSB04_030107 [Centaurea solstitialis]|uniref:Uncharacterized protein n=1 Tax=Centaurea solstitialis TaxID=347529 RepID=A0AA38S684_9ASTR|nr:hypothetical protein OSB04_030107 [Centaurea solstitialis]
MEWFVVKMKNVVTKRPSEENLEAVTMLLRSSYNIYRDFSCALLPSCLNLYPVPLTEGNIQSNVHAVDTLEMNKYCEETNAQNNESVDVAKSVYETSKTYGAYHIGHLLLEEIACRGIPLQDSFEKFLELEQLTRNSGENRSPECTIFLAELSYDFGISIIRAIDIH